MSARESMHYTVKLEQYQYDLVGKLKIFFLHDASGCG